MSTPVKKKVHIWDRCMQLYKETIPCTREIIDSPLWRKLIFPNGSRAIFRTPRRNSSFAICTAYDSGDGFINMDLFNAKDIVKLRNKINRLIKK